MWIAFIFQYLWDTKQLEFVYNLVRSCCELLSFFSIFGIQNNWLWYWRDNWAVVNCFHFSVSLGYKTTLSNKEYKIKCCELLSFFSIFGIQNNTHIIYVLVWLVVNCFHFSVSLGYKTTKICQILLQILLWIAFIFQYLWDTKQLICIF